MIRRRSVILRNIHACNIESNLISPTFSILLLPLRWGWSGGAKVLGKRPVPGRLAIEMIVGQRPTVLALGAGWGLFGHFYSPLSFLLFLPLSGRRPDID